MSQTVEYNGVTHEFPDDFSEADIADALSQTDAQPDPRRTSGYMPGPPAMMHGLEHVGQAAAKFGTSLIPPLFGTALGIAGTPLGPGTAIGGAGLGYGTGELLRRSINQATGLEPLQSFPQNAMGVGGAAALGAGQEIGSQALNMLMTPLGRNMLMNAYKVNPSLMEKFPQTLRVAERERIPVGPQGVKQADKLWFAAIAKRKNALLAAKKAGNGVQVAKLLRDVTDDVAGNLDRPMTIEQRSELLQKARSVLVDALNERSAGVNTATVAKTYQPPPKTVQGSVLDPFGNPTTTTVTPPAKTVQAIPSKLTPKEGMQLVQILDEHLKPEYRANLAGTGNAAIGSVEGPMRQSARQQLGNTVDQYNESTKMLQDMMGVRAALQDAASRPGRWVHQPIVPILPPHLSPSIPMSPQVASNIGLSMLPGGPTRQVVQNIPRIPGVLGWPLLFGRMPEDTTQTP